jgi:hypothetical protein
MQFNLVPDVCDLFASLLGINISHGREVWIFTLGYFLFYILHVSLLVFFLLVPCQVLSKGSGQFFYMLDIRLCCFCIQPLDFFCIGIG